MTSCVLYTCVTNQHQHNLTQFGQAQQSAPPERNINPELCSFSENMWVKWGRNVLADRHRTTLWKDREQKTSETSENSKNFVECRCFRLTAADSLTGCLVTRLAVNAAHLAPTAWVLSSCFPPSALESETILAFPAKKNENCFDKWQNCFLST